MSWIGEILGGGIIKEVAGVVDEFVTTDEEKAKAKFKLQELIQKSNSEIEQSLRKELEAKERIIVAELQQGDNYTKRARPTLIYFGLFVIFFNYCLVPLLMFSKGVAPEPFLLPTEFWIAWGGVAGSYTIGRTMEKKGVKPLEVVKSKLGL